jgi:hypothetical protein
MVFSWNSGLHIFFYENLYKNVKKYIDIYNPMLYNYYGNFSVCGRRYFY